VSDDLRRSVEELKRELAGVKTDLHAVNTLQKQTAEATERLTSRFDLFLDRFQEASEMWVQHDTDQLQRVTAVENENAALKEEWRDLTRRVEALEKKSPPAA